MLRLGLSFVLTGAAASASLYAIRLAITLQLGPAAVGLYQSAFTLSGIYVGFILQAMGGDYYPRLAGVGEDRAKRNQLVNEQTKMAVLLAAPGLVAALVFSDLIIRAMYSAQFAGASQILRWQVLGLLGRAVGWPMGFILLARGDNKAFLATELASAVLHVALVWVGVSAFGAQGAGMAFAVLYLCYGALIYLVVKMRHGYVCAPSTLVIMLAGSLAVAVAFSATFIPNFWLRTVLGGLVFLTTASLSLEILARLEPTSAPARAWRSIRKFTPLPSLQRANARARRWFPIQKQGRSK
jgi:PST family polysaccharide transporter